ncbi:MAG: hypothetical protein CME65_09755 [Halobacteriovoraceae bacterium]|nr:hypothetical protein [Halobacteriovoraceae bacterium]
MARRHYSKQSPGKKLIAKLKSSPFMPVFFVFTIIGALYVFTRMKGIEQDYKYNDLAKRIDVQKIQNKELKAKKARELSVKNLKAYAKKYNLQEPDEKHIIVVPKK